MAMHINHFLNLKLIDFCYSALVLLYKVVLNYYSEVEA